MPLYLDVHNKIEGLTREAIEHAHQQDVECQERHGVKYLKYWYDTTSGRVYCLFEGPNAEAGAAVHRESHGLVADEISEVSEGS